VSVDLGETPVRLLVFALVASCSRLSSVCGFDVVG
jgi:hypothetical protein